MSRELKIVMTLMMCGLAVGCGAVLAEAATSSYQPKPGARCRTGYVREVHQVTHGTSRTSEVLCVRTSPTGPAATTTKVTTAYSHGSYPKVPAGFEISTTVTYDGAKLLTGRVLTYTVIDATTRKILGTFSAVVRSPVVCTIQYTTTSTTQTLTGGAIPPYRGCAFGTVTVPAADQPVVSATFAAATGFRASVSKNASM